MNTQKKKKIHTEPPWANNFGSYCFLRLAGTEYDRDTGQFSLFFFRCPTVQREQLDSQCLFSVFSYSIWAGLRVIRKPVQTEAEYMRPVFLYPATCFILTLKNYLVLKRMVQRDSRVKGRRIALVLIILTFLRQNFKLTREDYGFLQLPTGESDLEWSSGIFSSHQDGMWLIVPGLVPRCVFWVLELVLRSRFRAAEIRGCSEDSAGTETLAPFSCATS